MTRQPTGRLVDREDGIYLVFERMFSCQRTEVWAWLTKPGHLEAWAGQVTGSASTGALRFRPVSDGGDAPWVNVSVLECRPPARFAADVGPAENPHRFYWHLTGSGRISTLTFGIRLNELDELVGTGVAWERRLDRLVAAHARTAVPERRDEGDGVLAAGYRSILDGFERDVPDERLRLFNGRGVR